MNLEFAYYATPYTIYFKRGYFHWGKISRKCWQDLSRGGNFHDISPISFIKSYGFNFPAGEIFAKNAISQKTRKLPPRENFHVYSTTSRRVLKNAIFAQFQGSIILKVYQISQGNLSFSDAKAYIYKIKKNPPSAN